ncbi:MAG: hypothetical protein A2046_15690 [Bacteroidetes bacterium GWA2_30_7]|nr:MAG: hypothetical protein A2046_15690 [Bacteroidetes bacterium GWA2_30_7]
MKTKIILFIAILDLLTINIFTQTLKKVSDISVPEGYTRVKNQSASIGEYFQNLDLKTDNNTVYLYNGQKKYNQSAQYTVIKMDIGKKDLQQCADAVMRLRAEYLYKTKQYDKIHFNFLSDKKPRYYNDYCKGDYSYSKFFKYMEYIFSYANTGSLLDELQKVTSFYDIQTGDVLIQKGNPYGHAVTVIDVAKNEKAEKIYLLAQSYMPAQETHILVNPNDNKLSPWYNANSGDIITTPEWTFYKSDLRRFKE